MIKEKILVIEDDAFIRTALTEIISSEGYRVVEAYYGYQGIDIAQNEIPDLIISDLMLPDIDGYSVLTKLKGVEKTAAIPFIFLTSETEKEIMRKGMNLGADDFLHKPVRFNELLTAIKIRLKKSTLLKKQSQEQIDEFRDSVSLSLPHELNTPLNVIIGYAETLKLDYSAFSENEIVEMVDEISSNALRLKRTIGRILQFVHLEMLMLDNQKLKEIKLLGICSPLDELNDTLKILKESNSDIDKIKISVEDIDINIHPDYFKIILEELIENSIKFSDSCEKISITGKKQKDKYIMIIEDKGIGMNNEQISRVGAFVQFNRKLYEKQGTGLGLAMVYKTADIFNCHINIESAVDSGTKVQIELPIA